MPESWGSVAAPHSMFPQEGWWEISASHVTRQRQAHRTLLAFTSFGCHVHSTIEGVAQKGTVISLGRGAAVLKGLYSTAI